MAKLWVIIKREYVERVRSKWFIFMTIFGPVFFAAITVLPGYMTVRGMRDTQVTSMHILDATGTGLGQRVADRLLAQQTSGPLARIPGAAPAVPSIVETVAPGALAQAESTVTHLVMGKQSEGYLVLDSLMLTEKKARYAGRNASSLAQMEMIETALRQSVMAAALQSTGIAAARVDSLVRVRVQMTTERIDERGRGGSGLVSAIFGLVIAFLLYMMIMLYGQNVLRGVLEEKMTRVAEVVVSSVKTDTLLAGKILGVGAVGLTQQVIWFGSAALLGTYGASMAQAMGAPTMQNVTLPTVSLPLFLALVFFFLFGYILYSSLFAAVGAMVNSQEEAQQAAQPVVLLLVASIIFVQPIMINPTSTLAVTLSIFPFTAPVIMPLRMSATQVPPLEIAASLVGVTLACWAAIWVSARIYRVGLLMTGKRPTLRELLRWIRFA